MHGIDLCDLHVAIAPRPLLALIEEYTPRFNLAADHIRARYRLLGVPEKFATEEAADPHSWTPKLRLAATDWLSRWMHGQPVPKREPDFEAEKPETLFCTPEGSLRYAGRGETIFSILGKEGRRLPPERKLPPGPDEIRGLIRYRKADTPLAPRLVATTQRRGYRIEKLEFLSEPGIYLPVWVFLPDGGASKEPATLSINEAGNFGIRTGEG